MDRQKNEHREEHRNAVTFNQRHYSGIQPQDFVADAINSVLHQSFADFEIIATDDGSTDNIFGEMNKFWL